MALPAPVAAIQAAGVSLWLDDLARARLDSGELESFIEFLGVVGVTTNPSIFEKAVSKGGEAYRPQLTELAKAGVNAEDAVRTVVTDDVRRACDVLRKVYDATDGRDGFVSIEVDPRLAFDTEATIAQAKELWSEIDRPNLLVKIPATLDGLPAITATIAAGISVNVTLIFSLERYQAVVAAYLEGLEQADAAGRELTHIASVASFFVSRMDSAVDRELDALGTDEAKALRGKAALANARLAYVHHEDVLASARWESLSNAGARPQRPLWASTGTKDAAYPDTLYVDGLVAPGTVNTVPFATLEAFADHGGDGADTVTGQGAESQAVIDELARVGVDYDAIVAQLEAEGVKQFVDAWSGLLGTVQSQLDALA